MEKKKRRKANCIYCTQESFCVCKEQLGDDCEGKCSCFNKGKYEPIKESNHGKE